MKSNQLPYYILIAFLFTSCGSKDNDPGNPLTPIDVSAQWQVDALGMVISAPADGQWQSKTFTSQELNLFASLDTANLSGTITPAAVIQAPVNYTSIYPNPFSSSFAMTFRFTTGYTGPYVFKYVVADSLMRPVDKKAIRLQATTSPGNPSQSSFVIMPNIPPGRYRFYHTLSSQADPHFYKSWGNIQKN